MNEMIHHSRILTLDYTRTKTVVGENSPSFHTACIRHVNFPIRQGTNEFFVLIHTHRQDSHLHTYIQEKNEEGGRDFFNYPFQQELIILRELSLQDLSMPLSALMLTNGWIVFQLEAAEGGETTIINGNVSDSFTRKQETLAYTHHSFAFAILNTLSNVIFFLSYLHSNVQVFQPLIKRASFQQFSGCQLKKKKKKRLLCQRRRGKIWPEMSARHSTCNTISISLLGFK